MSKTIIVPKEKPITLTKQSLAISKNTSIDQMITAGQIAAAQKLMKTTVTLKDLKKLQ